MPSLLAGCQVSPDRDAAYKDSTWQVIVPLMYRTGAYEHMSRSHAYHKSTFAEQQHIAPEILAPGVASTTTQQGRAAALNC